MTREEAINRLFMLRDELQRQIAICTDSVKLTAFCDTVRLYDKAIEALKEPKQGEWIPVTERLPDKNGFYLITFKTYENGRGVIEKFYRKTENIWTDDGVHRGFFFNSDEVTAWRLLPEPYKEEGDEK